MSHLQTYIDPISTRELLGSLSLAIDETRILREIENKKICLETMEFCPKNSSRRAYLEREITKLQAQLNYIRDCSQQI
jgi:hypothetical protein